MATTNSTSERRAAVEATLTPMYRGQLCPDDNWEGCDGAAVELTFADGSEPILITTGGLSNALLFRAAAHGLKQKLVDAAAISRDPNTGRSASVEAKAAAVREVYERLLAGEWNKRREGSGAGGSGGLLFAALCRMYDGQKTPEQIQGFLAGKSDAEQAALRKNPKVAAIIELIRAERTKGASGVDSDELLQELGS